MVPVLIVVSILVFSIVHMMPGDAAKIIAGDAATPESIAYINEVYGFDKPLVEQYSRYMLNIFKGDLGTSTRTGRPVGKDLAIAFSNTAILALASIAIAIVFGIAIGVISGTKQYSVVDNVSMFVALFGLSIPPFYLGLLLMLVFSVMLKWLPISAEVNFLNLILPAITLSMRSLATIARMTRSSMLEVMNQDYIQAAHAQGYSKRQVVLKHAFRNSMNTIVTVIGLQFGHLLGGAVVTEKVFGWPGLGSLIITAIRAHDFQVVQSSILLIAATYVVVNLVVDVIYAYVNPRIKFA
jgi:ABC-type dipeptide/oligopeptide/nickel transport system permease component